MNASDVELDKLKSLAFFRALTVDEIRQFVDISQEKTYEEGQEIFQRGSPGDTIYIIKSGEVAIISVKAGQSHEIARLSVGDFFGEIAFFAEVLRTATAKVVKRAVIFEISRAGFNDFIFSKSAIGVKIFYHIIGILTRRLRANVRTGDQL